MVCPMASGRRHAGGFAYVLVLVVLAIVALVATAAISLGATLARRSAEAQLLAVGGEIQSALASYREAGGAQGLGPKSLRDLLKDERFPAIRRHLRKIYADPMTGRVEWGVLKTADGSIVAVYSAAEGQPIKQTNFGPDRSHFEHASSYNKWTFGPPPQ